MNNLPEVIENIINDYVEQMDIHIKRKNTLNELKHTNNNYHTLYTDQYFRNINTLAVIDKCLGGRGYYNYIIQPMRKPYELENGYRREYRMLDLTEEQEEEYGRMKYGDELYEEYMKWIEDNKRRRKIKRRKRLLKYLDSY